MNALKEIGTFLGLLLSSVIGLSVFAFTFYWGFVWTWRFMVWLAKICPI